MTEVPGLLEGARPATVGKLPHWSLKSEYMWPLYTVPGKTVRQSRQITDGECVALCLVCASTSVADPLPPGPLVLCPATCPTAKFSQTLGINP